MEKENPVQDMSEQYLRDFFDLLCALSESTETSIGEIIENKRVKEITPTMLKDLSFEIITKLNEIYQKNQSNYSQTFNLYETVKKIENMTGEEAIERLKDDESCVFLSENAWKN